MLEHQTRSVTLRYEPRQRRAPQDDGERIVRVDWPKELEQFMGQFSIGQSVRRREAPRLLTGRGRYYDDLKLAGELHAAILRSPHAHAEIRSIDTRAALQMPGVHAVLTGKDYAADGLDTMPPRPPHRPRAGGPMYLPYRPAIAVDRVRHVGYPVAVIVADTLE